MESARAVNGVSPAEQLVSRVALEINDYDVIHIGASTPLVLAASLLARATHAPHLTLFPISMTGVVADGVYPITLTMWEAMAMANGLQYRLIELFNHVEGDVGFDIEPIAPAQIDKFGNVNNSVIGNYLRPKVRFPGPAGIDNLPLCPRTPLILYSAHHTTRTFVDRVDFITGAGFLNGGDDRLKNGIPGNGGPRLVVTNLAVMDFEEDSKRMRLVSLNPGVTLQDVQKNTGFELVVPKQIPVTPAPSQTQLQILREVIDPLDICGLDFVPAAGRRARITELLAREMEMFAD
jgi:acyl CoA:acetate/3-ketoacid CoA transferase beta subunit